MVVLPPAPHVSSVVLNWSMSTRQFKNVLHYTLGTDASGPGASIIGPRIVAAFSTAAKAGLLNTLALTSVTVTPLDTANAIGEDYTTGFPITGTIVGSINPWEVSAVISWKTNKRGRSYRGRTYIPAIVNNGTAANSLTSGQLNGLQTLANNLVTLAGTPDAHLAIVSYYQNKVLRQVPEVTWVTQGTVRPQVGSQRRRMP